MLETSPQDIPVTDPSLTLGSNPARPELDKQVGQVIEYFNSEFGLGLDETGNFQTEPSAEQLGRLKDWHEQTTQGGIIMPDMDTFTAKVVLARALMPQRDESGNITYLFGKGAGAELALQGDVVDRIRRVTDVPFRTHSDFEIYAVATDSYDVIPHSDRFRAVFGGQEIYPVTSTKGLHDLPPDYLHKTAETVNYGGLDFVVPRLELQFVDKFEKQNKSVEGGLRGKTDAEWLATAYSLDADLVHATIDSYVIAPETAKFNAPDDEAAAIMPVLTKKVEGAKRMLASENPQASDLEAAAAVSSDIFLSNFANNKGIENVADLIDLATGQLKESAAASIAASVRRKQERITAALQAKHEVVDAILQVA